jgi:hypothetical protein
MSRDTFQSKKYTLPIVASLRVQEEWQVSMSQTSDPEFSFARRNRVVYRTEDAFDVRPDFFALRFPEDALRFFERYGPFRFSRDTASGTKRTKVMKAETVKWSAIQQWQKDFEEALLAETIPAEKRWLAEFVFGWPVTLHWAFRSVTPEQGRSSGWARADGIDDAAIAECDDVVDALRVSIFLSRKSAFRWSRCARKGCNELFEQTTRRQKLYCSPECAHLQAVNDYNSRQKKAQKNKQPKPTKRRKR